MVKRIWVFVIVIVAFILSVYGYVMAQDEKSVFVSFTQADVEKMMDDIKAYLKQSEDHSPYVTEIVQKHIPLGTPQDDVLDAFKEAGFHISNDSDRKTNRHIFKEHDEAYYVGIKFWIFPHSIYRRSFGTYIYFKDKKVSGVKGRVTHNFFSAMP